MDNDERLKNLIMEKSKDGYAIISVYNPDTTVPNRKNTKRARILEKMIIDQKFWYKKIQIVHKNKEIEQDFIIFEKLDDEFNDLDNSHENLESFIQHCRNQNCFQVVNEKSNLQEYLAHKKFYHPITKSEKKEYLTRREFILTDLFEPPEKIGVWNIKKACSENAILYSCNDYLCSITLQPDGKWLRHYGCIKPVGASFKREYINSREDAFKDLWIVGRKNHTKGTE